MRKTTLFVLAGAAVALVAGRRPGGAVKRIDGRQVFRTAVRAETGVGGGVEGDAGAVDGADVEPTAEGEGEGEEDGEVKGGEVEIVDTPVEESVEWDDDESAVVADDDDAFAVVETPVEVIDDVEKTEKAEKVKEAAEKAEETAKIEKSQKSEKTVKSSAVAAAEAESPKAKEIVTEPAVGEPVSEPPTPAEDEAIPPALGSDPITAPSDTDSADDTVFGASGDTAEDRRRSSSTTKHVRRKNGLSRRAIAIIAGSAAAAIILIMAICTLVAVRKHRQRHEYGSFKYGASPVGKAPLLVRRGEEKSPSGSKEGFSKDFPDGGFGMGGARPGGYAEDRGTSSSRGGGFGSGSRAEGFIEEDSVDSSAWSEIVAPNDDANMYGSSLGNTFQQRF